MKHGDVRDVIRPGFIASLASILSSPNVSLTPPSSTAAACPLSLWKCASVRTVTLETGKRNDYHVKSHAPSGLAAKICTYTYIGICLYEKIT